MDRFAKILSSLESLSNLREIPTANASDNLIDLTSNDYLGIAADKEFLENFFSCLRPTDFIPTSSASRLLASRQEEYTELEENLSKAYNRPALIFNSGYHANTGIIRALADRKTLFLADKLVHASIIDGLNLSIATGASFLRFRHNDFSHLERLLAKHASEYERIVVIVETVYSMDGDMTDINALLRVKDRYPNVILYLDEAHAVGVIGEKGLGLAYSYPRYCDIDVVVGTFGKALASVGAYVVTSSLLHDYLVNTARSLIFSTALPPVIIKWTSATFRYAIEADDKRAKLRENGSALSRILGNSSAGHIQPYLIGDPAKALRVSEFLKQNGYRVLPIRTPTVPQGTDRLRFSLSAAHNPCQFEALKTIMPSIQNEDFKNLAKPFADS